MNIFNKGITKRRRNTRKLSRIILIVCEGEKTESNYFRQFRTRNSGVRIEIPKTNSTDPINLVSFTKKMIKEYDLDFEKGDSAWCIFDVDHHHDKILEKAVNNANKTNINAIISNPCFELWYLLHFQYTTRGFNNSDELISVLERKIPGYLKNGDYNTLLCQRLDKAYIHADKLVKYQLNQRRHLHLRESNPVTKVQELVRVLQGISCC